MNDQVQNLRAVGIGDPMPRHDGVKRVDGVDEMRAVLLTSPLCDRNSSGQSVAARLHVDGVDVAQLLREIGEASAQESSVDLFRLCLAAQRVLQQVVVDRRKA